MLISMLVSAVVSVCIVLGSLFLPGLTGGLGDTIPQDSDRQVVYSVNHLISGQFIPGREYPHRDKNDLSQEQLNTYPGGSLEDNIHTSFSVFF